MIRCLFLWAHFLLYLISKLHSLASKRTSMQPAHDYLVVAYWWVHGNSDGLHNCLSSYSSRKVTRDLLIFLDYMSHLLLETLITIDLLPTFFRCDVLISSLFFIAVFCELRFLEFLASLLQCQFIDAFHAQSLGVLKCVPSIWLCSCNSQIIVSFRWQSLPVRRIMEALWTTAFVIFPILSTIHKHSWSPLVDLCLFILGVTSPAV